MLNSISPPPPDVPAFNLEEVHCMQAGLMQHAERVLGPRSHDLHVEPARFVRGTTGSATRFGRRIVIELESCAAMDWQCCAVELGHELVHALDGVTGRSTWLEEGVACLFGLGQCVAMFEGAPLYMCNGRYREATMMVASIPDQFSVIKALRAKGTHLCSVTPLQLLELEPGMEAAAAAKLCRPF